MQRGAPGCSTASFHRSMEEIQSDDDPTELHTRTSLYSVTPVNVARSGSGLFNPYLCRADGRRQRRRCRRESGALCDVLLPRCTRLARRCAPVHVDSRARTARCASVRTPTAPMSRATALRDKTRERMDAATRRLCTPCGRAMSARDDSKAWQAPGRNVGFPAERLFLDR